MLFGKRPFGEGCSQERILREDIIVNARDVAFPAKPAVSADAKDFITKSVCPHNLSTDQMLAQKHIIIRSQFRN
jgi:hypothetical protein